MAKSKNSIQSVLNAYLEKNGSIGLFLPDGVELEIGITQQSKKGLEKNPNYCWVTATRDDRATSLDRYSMSMEFGDEACLVDQASDGVLTVV